MTPSQAVTLGGFGPQLLLQVLKLFKQIWHATQPEHSVQSPQIAMQSHQGLTVLHVVTTPSQVRELPGTLLQEVVGVQLMVPRAQVVVQVVASTEAGPRVLTRVTTDSMAASMKNLLIFTLLFR